MFIGFITIPWLAGFDQQNKKEAPNFQRKIYFSFLNCSISIQIHYVQDFLGNKMATWNRNYDAAQQIFGPGPACVAVRAGVKLLHAQLYRRGIHSIQDHLIRKGVTSGRRRVLSSQEMTFWP
jgi:hypothetical protein